MKLWGKSDENAHPTMEVPTAEQARATASSPSGCAMRCIAIGATKIGMLNFLPGQMRSTAAVTLCSTVMGLANGASQIL